MDAELRSFVRRRAGDCCEYCRQRQDDDPLFRFHVEHIIARQHGGATSESNLALACHHCNLHKGPNLTGIDPATGNVVRLFNPRTQTWNEHFAINGNLVVGLTDIGRATARLLNMNGAAKLQLRAFLR
ncbi:MAG TPA: HNH endonuclease [Tepidisphaeraceae bacterium]|nr:HNH endonuclease [Tepidisphaeraceae bacterium]